MGITQSVEGLKEKTDVAQGRGNSACTLPSELSFSMNCSLNLPPADLPCKSGTCQHPQSWEAVPQNKSPSLSPSATSLSFFPSLFLIALCHFFHLCVYVYVYMYNIGCISLENSNTKWFLKVLRTDAANMGPFTLL